MLSEPDIYWNHVPKFLSRIFQGTGTKEAKDHVYVARWIFFFFKEENVGTHDDFAQRVGFIS